MTILTLTQSLQRARRQRRLSQLELALRLNVSQRHVSFVENGRALPSRALLQQWLTALAVPLMSCNQILLQAGFAPLYGQEPITDQSMRPALEALQQLLAAHSDTPALVMDSQWRILMVNPCMWKLSQLIMPELLTAHSAAPTPEEPISMLSLLRAPCGLLANLLNPLEVAPSMIVHLQEVLHLHPELSQEIEPIVTRLRKSTDSVTRVVATPMMTTRFRSSCGELGFFSIFSTFGTPQHITLGSLRVEHLFAADECTRQVLRQLAAA